MDVSQASSLKGSTNTMISSPLKPDTNAHTICGRPTLKGFERFWKGSLRGLYERSIYERTFLSEPIENHAISNELSNVNHVKKHLHKHYRVFRRDREPSRIPIRTLERLRNKNRKVREFVYKGIRSYTPKSSKVHCYVKVKKQRNKAKLLFKGSGTIHKRIIKLKKRASRYLSLFFPNRLCLYKSQAHAANHCKFKLVSDIEKNPGPTPMHVDVDGNNKIFFLGELTAIFMQTM